MSERLSAFTRGRWSAAARVMLAAVGLAAFSSQVAAEGSRSLHPSGVTDTTTARGTMNAASTVYFPGGIVNGRQFLYVYARQNEYILLGSRNRTGNGTGPIRIFASPGGGGNFGNKGNESIPDVGTEVFICDGTGSGGNSTGRGLIANRNAELAGPRSVSGATGGNADRYIPCYYQVPSTGIYGVVFYGATGTSGSSINTPASGSNVTAWDVTVRSSTTTSLVDLNGRLFTYAWGVNTGSNNATTGLTNRANRISTQLYYVSTDGYRYRQEFRGVDPNQAAFYANSRGFIDTNNTPLYRDFRGNSHTVTGGRSATVGITAQRPEYPIFFSDVTPGGSNAAEVNAVLTALLIPPAPLPPQLTNPDFVGNVGGNTSTVSAGGMFTFDTVNTLTYEIVINRGATGPGDTPPNCVDNYDPANVCNRVLTGTALTGSHSVLWDGRDNNGIPFPAGNYPFQIVGRNGEIHFPIADIEGNVNGGPTLTKLNGPSAGDTTVYFDDRGYQTANGDLVGTLNGILCGGTGLGEGQVEPAPETYSLLGVDSNAVIDGTPGTVTARYYRHWNSPNPNTSTGNTDTAANPGLDCRNDNQFFGDAKGLDLWALEKSQVYTLPIEIIEPASDVDVGTMVTVTPDVLPGDTAYGTFTFTNAGSTPATGVTYSVTIGDPGNPITCPATVNISVPNPPPGITATWNQATCSIVFGGMPTTLAPGQTLIFNFNYPVALTNPGPIPVNTAIGADNETCPVIDPTCASNTANAVTNIAKPVVSVTKTSSPAPGSPVAVNDVITYTVSATIQNAPLTSVLTLTDTLGTGLTFGAVDAGNTSLAFSCSGSLTCTLPAGTATGTYTLTYTATVNNAAVGTVANNVTASGGGGDNPPSCGTCSVTHPLAAVPFTFCTAPGSPSLVFSIVNGINIYSYTPGTVTPDVLLPLTPRTISGNLNALMVDPVRDRLLAIQRSSTTESTLWAYDANNGGWYVAFGPFVSADFPRGGFNAAGTGYLLTGGGSPQVWEVVSSSTYGYTVTQLGTMNYDNTPTDPGSGDIAFDGDGTAWLAVGEDIWKVDFSGASPYTAVRQTKPTLGGVPSTIGWAGLAFADDGKLILANNAPSPSAYYEYNPADGTIIHRVNTAANASRDLASCAFPILLEPELSVTKTLDQVNGATPGTYVYPGDVLRYAITITNTGGAVATLFANDVQETVPANSTHVAGDNFTCTPDTAGSPCGNTAAVNVAGGGGSVTLYFTVELDPSFSATQISNAVTVPDVDCSAAPNDCSEVTPVGPTVSLSKSSDPTSGAAVSPGQTITYTVTVVVANAATNEDATITDTLSANQTFGSVTSSTGFTGCTGAVTCTLPAGTTPGTYTLVYTATVNADATGSVGNNVAATNPPGGDPDPVCTTCTTTHPLVPAVTVSKASNPASGTAVSAGQTITYTVTVVVANAATNEDATITDTLSANQTFGSVTSSTGFTGCTPALTCTLPSGTTPGTYTLVYTATVNADATGSVGNNVAATNPPGGDPDPVCTTCTTTHPLLPAVTVSKASNPASGTAVSAGQTITYTVTVVVANAATNEDATITDTLSANQTFGSVQSAVGFTNCPTGAVTCTLPSGTTPGTYTLVYTATVNADATGTVGNNVAATNPPGGDPDPVCTTCTTTHPLVPAVTVSKASNPASGAAVSAGQTITYTVTVVVANAATNEDATITDTLSANQTFGSVTSSTGFTGCTGAVTCTLPSGTTPGTYTLVYTATVNADATGTVGNNVTATNPPGGDPDPVCTTCTTTHPLVPAVTVSKASNPASGTAVSAGQTITYTVTVVVANAATNEDATITDTLSASQTFGSVTSSTGFTGCTGAVTCTLPSGTTPGAYTLVYTATVNADATGSVGNNVAATNPPGGDPDPVCTTCTTTHPLVPAVTVSKASNPASGTAVAAGQTITYTVTVVVANAATSEDVTLTDTLSANQTFGSVSSAVGFTNCPTGAVTCTLPSGTTPGTYTLVYTATVNADATGSVGNNVAATNPPGGDPDPVCTTCTTTHPLVPAVTVSKASNPASGTAVAAGQTITYTVTVVVANAATSEDVTLTDTLSANQTFGSVQSAVGFTNCPTGAVTCTLPSGTTPGTYTLVYTATVNADATGSVGNNVAATNPPGGDPDPVCTTCTTTHPLLPAVTVSKASNPASGAAVSAGQTITYTVTVVVANAATNEDATITDTLSANQTFGSVTSSTGFTGCTPALTCTLPSGTTPGTYTLVYTATVNADATGSVGNNVAATNPPGGDPDPVCTTCTTTHPLLPAVTVSKASNPASGTAVSAGQTITYTVTVVVANAATSEDVTLTDTLSANQTFGSVTSSTGFTNCPTGTVTCTLPSGTTPGTYTLVYTATVNADATGSVGNNVAATNPPGGDPDPVCTTCTTTHPLLPAVTVSKASNPASGTAVSAGQTITYTVTVVVANAATSEDVTIADTLSANQTFGSVTSSTGFTGCTGAVTCTLPSGTTPGTYTLVYTATVNADATGSVGNNVTATNPPGGDPDPVCTTCTTTHPLNPVVTLSKSANPASGTAVAAGQTITYTVSVNVANAALRSDVVVTDAIGTGLTFQGVSSSTGFINCPTGALTCTLPTGTGVGTYNLVYTATVDADALTSVSNSVTATGGGDPNDPNDPQPGCTTPTGCATNHPLKPTVTLSKSADPTSGTAVAAGQTITYTVSVTVANAALLSNVVVTDTIGAGLTFQGVSSSTGFTNCPTGTLTCTLPTGTAPGTYNLVYTATVDADATVSVSNSVAATGGNDPNDPLNPQPTCTTPTGCETEHPLVANVTVVKALTNESGTSNGVAEPGETLTYTITLSNSGGVAFTDYDFTENVPLGASLISVTGTGVTVCAPLPVVGPGTCNVTVATVPADGSTTVTVVFTVADPIPAGVPAITNLITGGDIPPNCPSPNVCTVTTPTEGRVAIAKTVADANSNGIAEPGETLTWTITLTNDGGAAVTGYGLTDPLDPNTTFSSASNGGSHGAGTVTWTGLTVPAQGTLVLTVVATVNNPIPDGVSVISNLVHETGGTPPDCSATPVPANCASIPTAPKVTVAKSLSGESITADGIAEPGEQLTYTITLRNHGGTAASNVLVNEIVPLHTTFVSGTPGWTCAPGSPAGTACDSVVNVPAVDAGGSPGVTTLTFTVQVVDPLPTGVTQIANAVALDDGTPPDCTATPTHPACVVTPTINLNLVKSVESVTATGPGTFWVAYRIDLANTGGSPITYTLTDTPDFTASGVTFTGNGIAATTNGTLNPGLPGGAFAVVNGTAVQISANAVTLAVGASHSYTVRIPIAVSSSGLGNALCTGAPGNGLYNSAAVTGSFVRDSNACAPVSGDQPLIRLVKTVRLGVDNNGDNYGNVGDVLHYAFAISNPGTVSLSAIDLIDPRVTDLQCDATTAYGEVLRVLRGDELFLGVFEELLGGSLAPGDSIMCSATYTITAQDVLNRRVVNTATTHGASQDGQVVSSTSTAIYSNIR